MKKWTLKAMLFMPWFSNTLQEEKENAHQNGSVAFESWLEAIIWWLLIQILLDVILENYSFPLKLLYFFLAIDIVDRYNYQGP